MNAEVALQQVEYLVKRTTGQVLGYLHRQLFKAMWDGMKYSHMIDQWTQQGKHDYDESYIRGEGAKLCKLLTTTLGVEVRKSFFREAILDGFYKLAEQQATSSEPQKQEPVHSHSSPLTLHIGDDQRECGEIRWVGRASLINRIIPRLQADCRILSIVGITGIGKTSLALRLMKDETLWSEGIVTHKVILARRSPNFETLAQAILPDLESQSPQQDPEQQLRAVLQWIQSRPYLVVLDMVEEIMQPDAQNQFQFIDPLYKELLVRVSEVRTMPSRLILTSQDQPPFCPEGRYPDRWLQERLQGLTETESLELFRRWGVSIQPENEAYVRQLIQVYEGHPLALRVIIGDLRSNYQGDVQLFWQEHGPEIEELVRNLEQERASSTLLATYGPSPRLVVEVRQRIEKTLQRLERDHPIAFELICQGSIFYKPVERERWLKRIRKYSPEQQALAFEMLQQRFLLEREISYRPYRYRLHSLIQSVAEQRRQQLEEMDE